MEFKSWQILALAIGAFASIVIIDIVLKYSTDTEFAANFPLTNLAKFAKFQAPKMMQEEQSAEAFVQVPNEAPKEEV
jgi:hypothetical protein